MATFHSYACRVKHIAHKDWLKVNPLCGEILLPKLQSVQISRDGCLTPSNWSVSQVLHDMDIDMGPVTWSTAAEIKSNSVATCFEQLQILSATSNLRVLSLRGWISPSLGRSIESLSYLRVLSLRTGTSLTATTLNAIAAFPFLCELHVHAGQISAEEFRNARDTSSGVQTFLSLHRLNIRAQLPLLSEVLDMLQPGTVRCLHLEAAQPTQTSLEWAPVFELVTRKTASSLRALTIEHTVDVDESDDSAPAAFAVDTRFTLHSLRPLACVRGLKRLVLDAMIPPDLCDDDVAQLAAWWPSIQLLDLGTLPDLGELPQVWRPRTTVAALRSFARCCPSLSALILPVDLSVLMPASASSERPVVQQALRRLCIGRVTAPRDIDTFVKYVLDVFPSLEEIECTSVDGLVAKNVEASLKDLRGDRTLGLENGP